MCLSTKKKKKKGNISHIKNKCAFQTPYSYRRVSHPILYYHCSLGEISSTTPPTTNSPKLHTLVKLCHKVKLLRWFTHVSLGEH